jgi:uncharacterized protein YbjT (DUF2867 family)
MAEQGIRLLLVGATGAVGQRVLARALADARVREVVAPTRRALAPQARLVNPVTDFADLDADPALWQVDAVVCALGTTMRRAGSQAAFAAVDRDLPLAVARRTRAAGARVFALTSSLGAGPGGNFYLRTKAATEAGVRALDFPSVVIVRPSLIDTERADRRPAEHLTMLFARIARPLIARHYRAVPVDAVAATLLRATLAPAPGVTVIESEHITAPGAA